MLEYATQMYGIIADVWDKFDQTENEKVQLEAGRIVSWTTKLVSLASLYNEPGW